MGNEDARNAGRLAPPPSGSHEAQRPRTRTERPRKADGDSLPTAPGAGTPARTDTGGPGTGGKAEKAPILGLADVTVPPGPAEPQKKQRRKPSPKKKKDEGPITADQLQALILTATNIVATRPGCEVWALKPEEAKQLAQPIANMIAKSEHLQNAGEYADAIALITASVMIFGPRAYIFTTQQKARKIQQTGGVKLVRGKPVEQKRKDAGGDRGHDADGHAHAEHHASTIYDTIPGTIF